MERHVFWLNTFVSGGIVTGVGYTIFAFVSLQLVSAGLESTIESPIGLLLAVSLSSLGVIFVKLMIPIEQAVIQVFTGERERLEPRWPQNIFWFFAILMLMFGFVFIGYRVTEITAQYPLIGLVSVENLVVLKFQAGFLEVVLSLVGHLFLAGSITSVFAGWMTLWVGGYRVRKGLEYSIRRAVLYWRFCLEKELQVIDESFEEFIQAYCLQCASRNWQFENIDKGERDLVCARCGMPKE